MTDGNGENNAGAGQNAGGNDQGGQNAQGAQQQTQTAELTKDAVLGFLKENPDIVRPFVDSAISKHVEEKNQMKAKLEEFELSGKTELQKTQYQLEKEAKARQELEIKLNAMSLNSFKNELIVDYKLDKDDIALLYGNSPEELKQQAEVLQKRYQSIAEKTKSDILKNASSVPGAGNTAGVKNPFNDDSWNPNEQLKLSAENPQLCAEMMKTAKANPNNRKCKN